MFLSIVIPVHNGEKYVEECLISCFLQDETLDEYEVICVSDGSTDNTNNILKRLKNRYDNLRVFYQEKGGVSSARNFGINQARGDYIWFVDADDFIENNVIKGIKQIVDKNHPDRIKVLSYCFHKTLSKCELTLKNRSVIKSNYPYKNTQITRTIMKKEYIKRHSILFYESLTYGEDAIFNYETRLYLPEDYLYERVCYFYRIHDDSTTAVNSEIKRKKYIDSCKTAINIVTQYYNKRVNVRLSCETLKYWVNMLLEQYYYFGSLDYNFSWDISCIHTRCFDFKLKRLNSLCNKIYISLDFCTLKTYVVDYLKKKEKARKKKQKRKVFIGYIKHPKRFLKRVFHYLAKNK